MALAVLEIYEQCAAQQDWEDIASPQYAVACFTSVYVRCIQKDRTRLAFG